MAEQGVPVYRRKKLLALCRPSPRRVPSPSSLAEQATNGARRVLYEAVRTEVDEDDDATPAWKSARLRALKRHLHSTMGDGGPVLQLLYDSIFRVTKMNWSWPGQNPCLFFSVGDVPRFYVEAEAGRLSQKQFFALWWMFVPEEQEGTVQQGVEAPRPSAMRLDLPMSGVGSEFNLQLVTCLSRPESKALKLDALTLHYNWILKRDTKKMFCNFRSLRHLTLTGLLNPQLFSILKETVTLSSFKVENYIFVGNDRDSFYHLILSQSECLQELDIHEPDNPHTTSLVEAALLRSLAKCQKLAQLNVTATILQGLGCPNIRVCSVKRIHMYDLTYRPSCRLTHFQSLFPSCERLSLARVDFRSAQSLDLAVEDFSAVSDALVEIDFTFCQPVALRVFLRFLRLLRRVERLDMEMMGFTDYKDFKLKGLAEDDRPSLPRLRHVQMTQCLSRFSYDAFSAVFFAAPALVSFRQDTDFQAWPRNFNQGDFVKRLRDAVESNRKAFSDLRCFRFYHDPYGLEGFQLGPLDAPGLPDERTLAALLEATGDSLEEVRGLLWLRASSSGAARRLADLCARKGLTGAVMASKQESGAWDTERKGRRVRAEVFL